MSAPVGSLRDLQDLLEGRGSYVFEQRPFPYYSVLMYAPTNGLNKLLHEYVSSHYELFNSQTGPNWLVAVIEDIGRDRSIEESSRPQDVYDIARYLGARVDDIPALVFFTDPQERNETLILRLGDILPESSNITDEILTDLFGRIAAIIDDLSPASISPDVRLSRLRDALGREWPKDSKWGGWARNAVGWLKVSATTATSVIGALDNVARLLKAISIY